MKPRIGIIGLGIMGGAMAEALIDAGYRVCGYDVHPTARRRLKKAGGRSLSSCVAVANAVDILIVSLPSVAALDDVVEKIVLAKRKAKSRLIVIETSTLPIMDKERARRRLQRVRATLLDCPISGTARRMKEGAWTIFVSGGKAACKSVSAIFAVFTRNAPYVGAFGNGSKMKFIANHLVAIYNVAVGESLTFARKMGLDPRQVWDLFATSPVVGTGIFKLRGKFMTERQYLPATMKVETWQKDMQVIGDMAKSVDCPTPLFTACVPIYSAAMAQGFSQHDTASVCEVLNRMAGGHGLSRARVTSSSA
ncbi:MAG: NAD(P)-dependent oxidoreductase [Rhizobiales bacterium]|nr:NAD(P)-dependent oxidoreductase [Hyphomicrobiales bacterium]